MNDDLIALDLRNAREGRSAAGLLAQLLELLRDVIAASDLADADALVNRIEACRRAVERTRSYTGLEEAVLACLADCRKAIGDGGRSRIDYKHEIATLVDMVREALALISGDGQVFSRSLGQSMDRFEALAGLEDLRRLKIELMREVKTLRALAADRQKQWEKASARFSARIDTLEYLLSESRREATTDPLTGIANRALFTRTCDEWIASGTKHFALAMLDIDRFKQLNDTLGHPAGDQAIVTVAETLTDSFRAGHDLVVRYGGDEFAVLMLGMSLPQAEGRLRNVASRIAAVSFGPDDAPLQITVSSGAVELSAGDTRASLVERADQALYEAKRLGRNRVVAKAKPTLRDLMG